MAQFSPDDAAELTCPLCHESFVEELEPEQPEPAAAPAPDPAVTQPPSAPQPTAPPVFQGGPFGFPFGFPFTMPMQAAPGMPPAQPHAMPFPFSFVPPAHAAATATAGGAAATQPGQPQEPTPFPFLRVPRNGTVVFTVGGGAPMGGGTIPAAVHVGTNPFAQLVQQIMQSLNAHEPYVRRAPCRRAVAMIRPNTPGRNSIQNEQWEGGNLDALLNRLFEQTAYVCARCWMAFVDLMLTSSARADSTCRLRPMRRRSRSSIDSSGKVARATAPCARTTSRPTTRSCRCPASTTFIKTACYHGSSEYVVLLAAWILVSDIHSHIRGV